MKPRAHEQQVEYDSPVAQPVGPPGFLPSFAHIRKLPPEERHAPLDAWVVWVNANRGRIDPALEQRLDDTLHELYAPELSSSDVNKSSQHVDEWLDGLDRVPDA